MIRIDTIEDLVRVLDDNPEWREAVRLRLLSSELLDMPATLARFAEQTDRRFEKLERFAEQTDRRLEKLERFAEETRQRFDAVDERFAGVDATLKSMRDDLGVLKGAHARNVAERDVGLIARSLGFRERRVLGGAELFDLAADAGADTSAGEVRSFVYADLVFEAENARGDLHYVAVEVSWTANGRDTARALRNAEFLARFTERPCHPVVAALRLDDRISTVVESGAVTWYRLPREVLEAA